ncbi:tetratricopeptide repeat protein [Streptomyces sp. NPDC007901]|uniref:tetratricopeptide repeat protein n=1 Tax=Streptomyces sp. NPDC007901 TaxID=3364785 RepID=UPI0036E87498
MGPERAERYGDFSGKMSSALALLGRTREAERLYLEVRARYALPMAQMFTGYALATLCTRLHPAPLRDRQPAKSCLSSTITLASLLPGAEERSFHSVFQSSGMALVEMHLGNLPEALRLVDTGLARLDAELPAGTGCTARSWSTTGAGCSRRWAGCRRRWRTCRRSSGSARTVPTTASTGPACCTGWARTRGAGGLRHGGLAQPPFWEVHFDRADLLAATGDAEGAVADLRRVVELEPGEADARVDLIGLLLQSGQAGAVEPLLEEGLRLAPGDARLLQVRGRLAWDEGAADAARHDFGLALQSDPGCVAALAGRAGLAFEAGDVEGALRDLDRAVGLDPGDADLRCNRAYVHQAAGLWQAAVDGYTLALGLPGADRAELLRGRAACHRELGDGEVARADLDAARTAAGAVVPAGAA